MLNHVTCFQCLPGQPASGLAVASVATSSLTAYSGRQSAVHFPGRVAQVVTGSSQPRPRPAAAISWLITPSHLHLCTHRSSSSPHSHQYHGQAPALTRYKLQLQTSHHTTSISVWSGSHQIVEMYSLNTDVRRNCSQSSYGATDQSTALCSGTSSSSCSLNSLPVSWQWQALT